MKANTESQRNGKLKSRAMRCKSDNSMTKEMTTSEDLGKL